VTTLILNRRSNAVRRDETNVYSVPSWSSLQATGDKDEAKCVINEKIFVCTVRSAVGICDRIAYINGAFMCRRMVSMLVRPLGV
jgi:hypothetical protein